MVTIRLELVQSLASCECVVQDESSDYTYIHIITLQADQNTFSLVLRNLS